MAPLTTKQRNNLPANDFAIPPHGKVPGAYPIENAAHARDALARASGKPEEARVDAAVHKKYPHMGEGDAGTGSGNAHPNHRPPSR